MSDFELKSIQKDAFRAALDKAVWYRALNEPLEAESICQDILKVEPENQEAIQTLLLALTDQFSRGVKSRFREAMELAGRLAGEYEREYYAGIVLERRAKSRYQHGTPGTGHVAYQGIRDAMAHYQRAEKVRPEANDDALLRWNACVRFLELNPDVVPEPTPASQPVELE